MYTNKANKFVSLLIFALLTVLLLTMTVLPIFAEDEEETPPTWWDNNNQIVGYIVAGVLAVAMIVSIIIWIPKDFLSKGKKNHKKSGKLHKSK